MIKFVYHSDGVLGLTSDSPPAQRSVLSQDSADGVLVVVQRHGSLGSKALLVVPHEGSVADLGSFREEIHKDKQEVKYFGFTTLIPGQQFNFSACCSFMLRVADSSVVT